VGGGKYKGGDAPIKAARNLKGKLTGVELWESRVMSKALLGEVVLGRKGLRCTGEDGQLDFLVRPE